MDEATTYDAFVSKTQEIANFKSSDFSQKQDSKPIDSASSTPKLEREDRERKSQSLGQKRTDRGILSVSKLPSSLGVNGHLSSDVLNLLSKFHQQLATNARERLIESGSGVNPNRIDPISTEMREFKSQILSEHFLIHQDTSDVVREHLFSTLPYSIRQAAEDASSRIRFNHLFSPLSLLSKERLGKVLGRPLPQDGIAIQAGLHKLGRASSIACAKKSLKSSGTLKCSNYVMQKIFKRIRLL